MKKTLKKIIAVVLVLTALFTAAPVAQAERIEVLDEIDIEGVYVLDEGTTAAIAMPETIPGAVGFSGYSFDGSIKVSVKNDGTICCKPSKYGATVLAIDGYNKYGSYVGTEYYVVVSVSEYDKTRKGRLKEAYDMNETINYKEKWVFEPYVEMTKSDGLAFLVLPSYTGDAVDCYGNDTIYGYAAGFDSIHAYVVDTHGNLQTINFNVTVKYTFWQWLIRIFLFGFIWY